jgi:hypothetical protein
MEILDYDFGSSDRRRLKVESISLDYRLVRLALSPVG